MISLFVRPQPFNILNEFNSFKETASTFRKLSLYPTELRGHSEPFIFDLILRCTNFYAFIHSHYLNFTQIHKARPEKDRKSTSHFFSIDTFKFTTRLDVPWGESWLDIREAG